MAVDPIANQIAQQAGVNITPADSTVTSETVVARYDIPSIESDTDFQSVNSLMLKSALASIPPGGTPVDPGNNLVTFSTVAEAKAWLGSDVDTTFFERSVVNGVIYLKPLYVERPKTFNYSNIAQLKQNYFDTGETPIAFTKTLPTASAFLKLHSMEQTVLLQLLGDRKTEPYPSLANVSDILPNHTVRTGNVNSISLTFAVTGSEPATTVVLSQDFKKVRVVEKLQASDFSIMSYEDQLVISNTPAFNNMKTVLGLTGTQQDAINEIRNTINAIKTAFPDVIDSNSPDSVKSTVYAPVTVTSITDWTWSVINTSGGTSEQAVDGRIGLFTREQRDLYIDQLKILAEEIATDMAVFNMTSIADKTAAIKTRFDRTLAFGDIPIALSSPDDPSAAIKLSEPPGGFRNRSPTEYVRLSGYTNIISLDDNKTVKEGFDLFIAQEKIYLENAQSRRALIKSVVNHNFTMDAPGLLYRLQNYANRNAEADIKCASEELRQQNDLLNSYSKMQQFISTTVGLNKETVFMGLEGSLSGNHQISGPADVQGQGDNELKQRSYFNDEQLKIISLFQTNNGAKNTKAPKHPIEKLREITRPYVEITGSSGNDRHGTGWLVKKGVAHWQQVSNSFGETVNLIGQETQNSLNKISGFEKDKARYTDMASNTLSKMNEMILAIGRSL